MDDIQHRMNGISIAAPIGPNNGGDSTRNIEESLNDNFGGTAGQEQRRNFWFNALTDDYLFQLLVGKWDGETVHIPYSSLYHPGQANGDEETMENSMIEVEPFRKITSKLPFALRFKLELHLFDNNIIETQQVYRPIYGTVEEWDDLKEEMAATARSLVVAFIQQVVPPLLEIDWETNIEDGGLGLDVDNFALSELFAEAFGSKLCTLKQVVKDMDNISFDQRDIENAMCQAQKRLNMAMKRCGSERELSFGDCTDIELLKRRAMWQYAKYIVLSFLLMEIWCQQNTR